MKNILNKILGKDKQEINSSQINHGENFGGGFFEENNNWLDENYEEGQLSVDIYQTPDELIVKSTIAGVKAEDIDISLNNDMLTIRGKRKMEEEINEEDYLYKECYWGSFSRSIILPMEVKADGIKANLENGILTVALPKEKETKETIIKVKEK